MTSLLEALPQGFDFYHLGRIELREEGTIGALPEWNTSDDRIGIAFSIEGEARGVLALLVSNGLDLSTYSEAGNIIASRLASDLADRHGLEVSISPPRVLSRSQLQLLFKSGERTTRSYVHRYGLHAIPLQAVLLPAPAVSLEETGNA